MTSPESSPDITSRLLEFVMTCRICGNGLGHTLYNTWEMMFGYRDFFRYFQCSGCGCLQISEFPKDMTRYYPSQYYSFMSASSPGHRDRAFRRLKASARRIRNSYIVFGTGIVGGVFGVVFFLSSLSTCF